MTSRRAFARASTLAATVTLFGGHVTAQTVFERATAGASCTQEGSGRVVCKYVIGSDLAFSIAGVGEPDAGISFLRSNEKGDYYARFGVAHGCVIVAPGERTPGSSFDFAFVSPQTGRVYRSWQECRSARK